MDNLTPLLDATEQPAAKDALPEPPARQFGNLSAVGAKWQAPEYVIDRVALSDDGILYIDDEHEDDMRVMSYVSRLRHNKVHFRIEPVSHTEIKRLQQAAKEGHAIGAVDLDAGTKTAEQEQINRMIAEAASLGASDIHFIPDVATTYVMYRINGIPELRFPLDRTVAEELIATLYTSMCEQAENYEPSRKQNARLKEEHARPSGLFVCRIATGPAARGVKLVIRLYPDTGEEPVSLEQLGYLPEQCNLIRECARKTSGIITITGTTGSGKSTTMANYLKSALIESNGEMIIATAEDPVEQPIRVKVSRNGEDVIYLAVQEPIRPSGVSEEAVDAAWVEAIDHMLRSDPDYIMIGELRGKASVQAAIRAALTGHPTLATLHVKDAMSTFDRLADAGVPLNLLTDPSLFIGIVNQSLVPVLCTHCSVALSSARDRISASLQKRLLRYCNVTAVRLRGEGCGKCRNGISGRTVCAEVVLPDPTLMSIYRSQGTLAAQRHWVSEAGGITQCQHLIRLINEGKVDPEIGERLVRPLDSDQWLQAPAHARRPNKSRRTRSKLFHGVRHAHT